MEVHQSMTQSTTPAPEARNRAQRRGNDPDRLVTAAELAARWGVSRAHIYNLLDRGLPSVQIGRCRRFRLRETDAWLDAEDFRKAAS